MSSLPVKLTFPECLIKKPVIYEMAKECQIIPNIRRAKVTETVGEVVLELEGKRENLEKATKYLVELGVQVEPVEGDVVM